MIPLKNNQSPLPSTMKAALGNAIFYRFPALGLRCQAKMCVKSTDLAENYKKVFKMQDRPFQMYCGCLKQETNCRTSSKS